MATLEDPAAALVEPGGEGATGADDGDLDLVAALEAAVKPGIELWDIRIRLVELLPKLADKRPRLLKTGGEMASRVHRAKLALGDQEGFL